MFRCACRSGCDTVMIDCKCVLHTNTRTNAKLTEKMISLLLFPAGLVVASVAADETSTFRWSSTTSKTFNNTVGGTDGTPITVTASAATNTASVSITTSDMNTTNTKSTITPSTTKQKGESYDLNPYSQSTHHHVFFDL